MRRKVFSVLVLVMAISLIGLLAAGQALAVEGKHQQPQAGRMAPMAQQPGTGSPQQTPGMMGTPGMQGNTGQRMRGPGMTGGSGGGMMRGMMRGSGQRMMGGSGGDMMGGGMMRMMGPGMMRMMRSHMMGGPGGMGRMMGSMGKGKGKGKGKGMGRGMMARMTGMLEKMNLTPEQWSKVRKLARERMLKMVDLRAIQAKVKIQLSGLRWDHKADPKRVKELFAQKAMAQAEMFLAGLDYLRSLKGILTPEQAKKMEPFQMK